MTTHTRYHGNTRRRHSRRQAAPKPVVIPELPSLRKAKNLPMFGPGIPIRVPLHLWPAYMQIYQLEPIGYREQSNTLLVKRVPKEGQS